jgi:transcriptional/translational regulatory protein YebC/TACO1
MTVPRSVDEESLTLAALSAGAEDVVDLGETWEVITAPSDLLGAREALEKEGISVLSSESVLLPSSTVELSTEAEARKVLRLIDALEDFDDVQNVVANFDIPDEIMEEMEEE